MTFIFSNKLPLVVVVLVMFLTVAWFTQKTSTYSYSARQQLAISSLKPKPIKPIETRNMIAHVLQEEGMKVGAELGVQQGLFSEHNLNIWKSCERYYLVDVWAQQVNYKDGANVGNKRQNELYESTVNRMKRFGDKVVVLRDFTSNAVNKIPDGSLDFLYVDARHDYCGTIADLRDYYPKVKSGGIIAGHDFLNSDDLAKVSQSDWSLCGDGSVNRGAVRGAVEEFANENGLQIVMAYNDGPYPSFMIRV
jgi:hypothetical protein